MLLELGGVRLLTDPLLRGRVAHLRRHPPVPEVPAGVDAVLLSHLHYDHLDLPSLRRLPAGVRMLGPVGAAPVVRFAEVEELAAGDTAHVAGVRVEATPADHAARRRPLGGPRAEPVGFVVRSERSVYFAGDTGLFGGMEDLRPLDVALLPIAGWGPAMGPGHMDADEAARAARVLRPRIAVPIHWGTLHPRGRRRGAWFSDPPRRFAAQLEGEVDVRVLRPGESLEL